MGNLEPYAVFKTNGLDYYYVKSYKTKGGKLFWLTIDKDKQTEEKVIEAIRHGLTDLNDIKIPITDRIAEELIIHGI